MCKIIGCIYEESTQDKCLQQEPPVGSINIAVQHRVADEQQQATLPIYNIYNS